MSLTYYVRALSLKSRMKTVLYLIVVLPLVLCHSVEAEKRFWLPDPTNHMVTMIKDTIGTGASREECESACQGLWPSINADDLTAICQGILCMKYQERYPS